MFFSLPSLLSFFFGSFLAHLPSQVCITLGMSTKTWWRSDSSIFAEADEQCDLLHFLRVYKSSFSFSHLICDEKNAVPTTWALSETVDHSNSRPLKITWVTLFLFATFLSCLHMFALFCTHPLPGNMKWAQASQPLVHRCRLQSVL